MSKVHWTLASPPGNSRHSADVWARPSPTVWSQVGCKAGGLCPTACSLLCFDGVPSQDVLTRPGGRLAVQENPAHGLAPPWILPIKHECASAAEVPPESLLFEPPSRGEGVLAGLQAHCVNSARPICSFCFQSSSAEDGATEKRAPCWMFAHLRVWFSDQGLGFGAEPLLLPFTGLPVSAVHPSGKANERVRPSYRKSVGPKIDLHGNS